MKILENKTYELSNNLKVSTAKLALECLSTQPQGGFSIDEIEKRLRIKKVLDNAQDTIELEDADFLVLKGLVKSMKWAYMHESFVDFTHSFDNPKDKDVKNTEPAKK